MKKKKPKTEKPKGKHLSELWDEAKEGSGFTGGDHPEDATVLLVSGPKGLAIVPNGNKEQIKKLADGFSVMAKVGAMDVKMIEIEEVQVSEAFSDRFQIVGGGVSITVNSKDSERVKDFLRKRVAKKRDLRLVISLSDFHRGEEGRRRTVDKLEN